MDSDTSIWMKRCLVAGLCDAKACKRFTIRSEPWWKDLSCFVLTCYALFFRTLFMRKLLVDSSCLARGPVSSWGRQRQRDEKKLRASAASGALALADETENTVATRDPYEVQEIAEEPKASHGDGEGSLCAMCLFAAKQKGNENMHIRKALTESQKRYWENGYKELEKLTHETYAQSPWACTYLQINDWIFLKLEALSVKVSYVRFAVLGAWYEKENDTAFDRPNHHPLGEPASNGATPVERTKAFLEMRSYCGVVGKKIALSAGKHGEDTFHQFSIRFNQWIQHNPAVLQQKWLYQAEVSSFNHASYYTLAGAFTVAYIALGMVLLGWGWYLNAFPF